MPRSSDKQMAAVSISKMLSIMIRWVAHLWDGCMHSTGYLRNPEHLASVRIFQSQLQRGNGRRDPGERISRPWALTSPVLGINTVRPAAPPEGEPLPVAWPDKHRRWRQCNQDRGTCRKAILRGQAQTHAWEPAIPQIHPIQ